MAKKIFAILVVVILLTSVFGCAPKTVATEQPQAATQAPAEKPVEATKAPEPTKEEVKAPEAKPAETVMLDYYIVGAGDTDQRPLVEKAINDYLAPTGIAVTFHIIGWGDWTSKAITAIQAGEPIDIFFTADWYFYRQLVTEGLLRPLNDDKGEYGNLLEQYGQGILSSLNPAFITGTQIDGVNYAVPTNKELTVPEGFLYNVAWAEEIGLTPEEAAKIKSYKDMEPWLAKAKAAHPDEYPFLTDGGIGFMPWVQGFASGISDRMISVKFAPDANGVWDESIVSVMETDWAKETLKTFRDWYTKGYIHPDAGLSTFDPSQSLNAGKFLFEPMPLKGDNIKAQEMVNASGNAELRLGEIYGQPKVNITTHSGGSMLAIPMQSEHPVEAMKLLNLMHTDSKLINMMLFGVEGTHWAFESDGRVNILNSGWIGAHPGPWVWADVSLQAVTNKEDPEKNKKLIEYSNDSLNHPSLGFRFVTDPVAAELTAVNAVYDGMNRALFTGYVDPEVELPKYIQALKDAGFDTVKAEVEKQYTEWKAKKGQ